MKAMKKVEIVIDSLHIHRIVEILERKGVSGYTIVKDVQGKGDRGIMAGDEVTDVFKNSYIFTVCDEKTSMEIAEEIKPLLKKIGGICIISDVLWVSH